jgi:hypothetical protein
MDTNHDNILQDTEVYAQAEVVAMRNEDAKLRRLVQSEKKEDKEELMKYTPILPFTLQSMMTNAKVHTELAGLANTTVDKTVSQDQLIGVLKKYVGSRYMVTKGVPITPAFIDAYASDFYRMAAGHVGDPQKLTIEDIDAIFKTASSNR